MRRIGTRLILFACLAACTSRASMTFVGRIPDLTKEVIVKLQFVSEQVGYVVGRDTVWRTDDGGATWKRLEMPPLGRFGIDEHTAQFLPSGVGWLYTLHQILVTDDYGNSWRSRTIDAGARELVVVDLALSGDGRAGWAAGGEWVLLSSDPEAELASSKKIPRYALQPKADGLYVQRPTVLTTHDRGSSWTKQNIPQDIGYDVRRIRFLDSQTGMATTAGSIIVTKDGGATWQHSLTQNDTMYWGADIFMLDHDTAWVSFNNGTVLRTYNGGHTWSSVLARAGLEIPDRAPADTFPVDMWFWSRTHGLAMDNALDNLLSTHDGGRHWSALFPQLRIQSYSALSPTQIWLISDGCVFRVTL